MSLGVRLCLRSEVRRVEVIYLGAVPSGRLIELEMQSLAGAGTGNARRAGLRSAMATGIEAGRPTPARAAAQRPSHADLLVWLTLAYRPGRIYHPRKGLVSQCRSRHGLSDPNQRFDPGSLRPSGILSNPLPLRASSNSLNYRAFNIRTKMAVVRLRRRKSAERDRKRPKVAP
jgi:hypothetical protein